MSSSALKILSSFFSRSEIFERTFGLAHWVSRTDFVSLASILRALKTKEEQTHTKTMIIESYYLLREWMSSHDCLSCHRARAFVVWFFFECAMTRLPESRVKRCQIKYKMLCSPFAFTDAREKIWDAHFLQSSIQLCAHMYVFDVHVLCVRVICMRCEESKHTNSESCNRRIKRWKYPRISAFLRRLFGKLKDVFFKKKHMCNAFFFVNTTHIWCVT